MPRIRLNAVLCCLALWAACDLDNSPIGSRASLFEQGYPLQIGNKWEYSVGVSDELTMSGTGLEPDSTLVEFVARQVWEVTAIDTIDGEAAYRIDIASQVVSGEEGKPFTYGQQGKESSSSKWLAVRADTLVEVASTVAQLDEGFSMKPVQSAQDAILLVMPLRLGASWAVSPGPHTPPSRSVLALEEVAVPAGRFQAFRVKTANPLYHLWQEQHWYGTPGLVKYFLHAELAVDPADELGDSETLVANVAVELTSYELR